MFHIDEDMTINITRGDTAYFTITAENDGVPYQFNKDDVVRIKVFKKKDCTNVAFQKDFLVTEPAYKVDIILTEEETKFGEVISKPVDYWYEIELNPYTAPQTIIGYDDDGAKIFKLFPEGRDLGNPVTAEDVPVVDAELSVTSPRPVENRVVTNAMLRLEHDVEKGIYHMQTQFDELAVQEERRHRAVRVASENGVHGLRYYDGNLQVLTNEGVWETIGSHTSTDSDVTVVPASITVSTDSLDGETVTCSVGSSLETATFTDGVATFEMVEFGTATITCGSISTTVEISSGNSYTATLNGASATLNLTTNTLDGKTVTVTVGESTYNGTFENGLCVVPVYEFGTATIVCDGDTLTQEVVEGESYSLLVDGRFYIIQEGVFQNDYGFAENGGTAYTKADGSDYLQITDADNPSYYIQNIPMWAVGKTLYMKAHVTSGVLYYYENVEEGFKYIQETFSSSNENIYEFPIPSATTSITHLQINYDMSYQNRVYDIYIE